MQKSSYFILIILFLCCVNSIASAPASAEKNSDSKYLLFVELRGIWGKATGDLPYTQTNRDDTSTDTSRQNIYKANNPTILGGGLTGGYYLTQEIPITLSFDFNTFSTSEVIQKRSPTNERTISSSGTVMTTGLGIRPTVELFSKGYFYGGGGLLVAFPASGTLKEVNSESTSTTTTIDVNTNLGLGAYGEFGFQYAIGNLYFGIGTKISYLLVNNNGTVTTQVVSQNDGSGSVTTETTHSDSFSTGDQTIESAKSTATQVKALDSSVQANLGNFQLVLSVGYKI